MPSLGTESIKHTDFPWGLTPFIYIHSKQSLKQVGIQKLCGYGLNLINLKDPKTEQLHFRHGEAGRKEIG